MGHREDLYIPVIHAYLEAQLGRRLCRLDERSHVGPSHDLETCDDAYPVIAVEAKELISADFLSTRSQVGHSNSFESTVLRLHWMVSYSGELGTWYDPKTWKHGEKAKVSPPHDIGPFLEPHLATLERFGIRKSRDRDTGTAASPEDLRSLALARLAISTRVDGVCLGSDPSALHPAGIDIAFSYGYVRAGIPDCVAERIQSWIDSPSSTNLRESLGRSAADEHHAALWLASDPEADSARELGTDFIPTASLALPEPIDTLWAFLPPVVWRYASGSWSAGLFE